jgi:hypothetical protein
MLCEIYILVAFLQGSQGGREAEGKPQCGQTPFYPYYNRM